MNFDFEPFQLWRDTLSYDECNNGILGKYQLSRHGLVRVTAGPLELSPQCP
jgi:hypothetical protein